MTAKRFELPQSADSADDQVTAFDEQLAFLESPLVTEAVDAVIAIDATGRVLSFNRAAVAMFGYTEEEAGGQELAGLIIPPRLRDAHRVALERLRKGGDGSLLGRRVEMTALNSDATEFPVELVLTQLGAEPLVVVGTLRDISKRRLVERTSTEADALLRQTEQLSGIGTWSWDPDTDQMTWSDEMYRLYGYEPGSVEPSYSLSVHHIHPDDFDRVVELNQKFRNEGSLVPIVEYRLVQADGSEREVIARAVRIGPRPANRMIGTIEDVTERHATQRDLATYLAVTRGIADWRPADEGVSGLLQRVANGMGCAFGAIWLPEPDGPCLVCRGIWRDETNELDAFEAETRRLRLTAGRGLPGRAWLELDPIIVESINDEPDAVRKTAAEGGLVSAVAFPARRGEATFAAFEFLSYERLHQTARLSETLMGIAHALGYAIERNIGPIENQVLSVREREILALAADGFSTPGIAERLVLSSETVKSHFGRIYAKLGVADRAAAVAKALRRGFIE